MIKIVIDATPIISALIGGTSREILFDPKYDFLTTEFTINEVKKYLAYISKKSKIPLKQIEEAMKLPLLTIYGKNFYSEKIENAKKLIEHKDKKDIDILALTLKTLNPLWSEDTHFEGINEINLLKTKDFF